MDANKRNLLLGTLLVVLAFVCAVGIFYFLVDQQRVKSEQIGDLEEQINVITLERELAENRALELEDESGRYLDLDKLINKSREMYGEEESSRREGYLWIDRSTETMLVTLGALNGLASGSRITIYNDNERVGFVRVETPLDVVSYVRPISLSLKDFEDDYYRAVFEQ